MEVTTPTIQGRLNHWREKFCSRRYRAIVVNEEPEAQVEKLSSVACVPRMQRRRRGPASQ